MKKAAEHDLKQDECQVDDSETELGDLSCDDGGSDSQH